MEIGNVRNPSFDHNIPKKNKYVGNQHQFHVFKLQNIHNWIRRISLKHFREYFLVQNVLSKHFPRGDQLYLINWTTCISRLWYQGIIALIDRFFLIFFEQKLLKTIHWDDLLLQVKFARQISCSFINDKTRIYWLNC